MFVGVGINDENYTLLDCHFNNNLGDLLLKMQDVAKSEIAEKCTIELSFPDKDVNWEIRGDVVNNANRDNFYVFKIFKIRDYYCPYILVRWHAYDGVDFEVEEFDSIRLAREAMWSHYNDDRDVYSDVDDNDDRDMGPNSTVLDTGEEFLMQQIVAVGTYAEIEEEREHKMNKNVVIGFGLAALELGGAIVGYDVGSKICKSFGIGGFKRVIFSIAVGRFIEEEYADAYRIFISDERYNAISKDLKGWLEEKLGPKKKEY